MTDSDYLNTAEGQRYRKFVDGHRVGMVDLVGSSAEGSPGAFQPTALEQANVVTSRVHVNGEWMHRPLLDIDMDAMLLPSSTPGHHHLYVDRLLSWEDYKGLLLALSYVGVCEVGYVGCSLEREETRLRLPWIKKQDHQRD